MKTFKENLTSNIRTKIAQLKRSGTTAMSVANLLQVTPTPPVSQDAPYGPESYRALFELVVAETPAFKRFACLTRKPEPE